MRFKSCVFVFSSCTTNRKHITIVFCLFVCFVLIKEKKEQKDKKYCWLENVVFGFWVKERSLSIFFFIGIVGSLEFVGENEVRVMKSVCVCLCVECAIIVNIMSVYLKWTFYCNQMTDAWMHVWQKNNQTLFHSLW